MPHFRVYNNDHARNCTLHEAFEGCSAQQITLENNTVCEYFTVEPSSLSELNFYRISRKLFCRFYKIQLGKTQITCNVLHGTCALRFYVAKTQQKIVFDFTKRSSQVKSKLHFSGDFPVGLEIVRDTN